jgi:hypothetical protein
MYKFSRIQKLKEELLPSQIKFLEILASKVAGLNYFQLDKFSEGYMAKFNRTPLAPLTISEEWLELQKEFKGKMPQDGSRFIKQEDLMKAVSKWYQAHIPGFGLGAVSATAQGGMKEEKKEEKQLEEKVAVVIKRKFLNILKKF